MIDKKNLKELTLVEILDGDGFYPDDDMIIYEATSFRDNGYNYHDAGEVILDLQDHLKSKGVDIANPHKMNY